MTLQIIQPRGGKITIVEPDGAGERFEWMRDSVIDFAPCRDCADWGDTSHVTLISASAYGTGDILETSNEHAISGELYGLWQPWVRLHESFAGGTSLCVDVDELDDVPDDVWADITRTLEWFLECPVLDESDYSERELEAFRECFEFEIPGDVDLIEDDGERDALTARAWEIALNDFYGYSDPGYIDREHVAECFERAGLTVGA